jgi:hypothetical protein
VKYCPYCKTLVDVTITEEGDTPESSPALRFIKLLSPGNIRLNRVYKCNLCHHRFRGMNAWNALLVPLLLIGFIIGSVFLFLFIILRYVS